MKQFTAELPPKLPSFSLETSLGKTSFSCFTRQPFRGSPGSFSAVLSFFLDYFLPTLPITTTSLTIPFPLQHQPSVYNNITTTNTANMTTSRFEIAKTVLTETEKDRLLACYLNCNDKNVVSNPSSFPLPRSVTLMQMFRSTSTRQLRTSALRASTALRG